MIPILNSYFITFLLLSCVPSPTQNEETRLKIDDTGQENNSPPDGDSGMDTHIDLDNIDPEDDCNSSLGQEMDDVLTTHFTHWLNQEGYDSSRLARIDISGGSFGGLISEVDCIRKEPIIFIHGNSDQALYGIFGGWEASRTYFLAQGYRSSELYATTYGQPALRVASDYTHDKDNILQLRQFIEAVISYTGAEKIDIISHSLGVTMTRRAILGGVEYDRDGESYEIGAPLTEKIDSFVGIAGGNQGLASCALAGAMYPICDEEIGLHPGWLSGETVLNRSRIIETLNTEARYEGDFIYSMWTNQDAILGPNCLVWGVNSCQIPNQDGEYSSLFLDHIGMKNQTAEIQHSLVVEHILP